MVSRAYLLPDRRRVRRAREWRLYDDRGMRYVDFWQADGAAMLGHRPHGLAALVAAEIDRGLWAPLPTAWSGRLERSLARLAAAAGIAGVLHPATSPWSADPLRWLPLSETARPTTNATVVLPFPGLPALAGGGSAVVDAASTRAAELLAAYLDSPEAADRVRLAASLSVPSGYRLDGIWLIPKVDPRVAHSGDGVAVPPEYQAWREAALTRGLIVPPDPWTPMAVPGILSRTERASWEEWCNERTV